METQALTELGTLIGTLAKARAKTSEGTWIQATHIDEPRAICTAERPQESVLGVDGDGMAIFPHVDDAAFVVLAHQMVPKLEEAVLGAQANNAVLVKALRDLAGATDRVLELLTFIAEARQASASRTNAADALRALLRSTDDKAPSIWAEKIIAQAEQGPG